MNSNYIQNRVQPCNMDQPYSEIFKPIAEKVSTQLEQIAENQMKKARKSVRKSSNATDTSDTNESDTAESDESELECPPVKRKARQVISASEDDELDAFLGDSD